MEILLILAKFILENEEYILLMTCHNITLVFLTQEKKLLSIIFII